MQVKLGVCNHILPGSGIFAPKFVAAAGLDGMSVEFGNYDRGFPLSNRSVQEAYLEAQQQYGIEYANIGMSGFDFIPFFAHPGHSMHAVVQAAVRAAVDAAAFMGIPLVFIPTFGVSEIFTEDQFRYAVRAFQFACEYAQKKNIRIGAENTMEIERQLRLVEEVKRENFGLFYDSNNMFHDKGYDQVEMLEAMYPYMEPQLHVKDGANGVLAGSLLGQGESSFYAVIEALKRHAYSGWIIIENLYEQQALRGGLHEDAMETFMEDVRILKNAVR